MSTRFYYGTNPLATGQRVDLPKEESRHLLKTMRARPGDSVIIFGNNLQFAGELIETDGGIATILVGEGLPGPAEPRVRMTFLIPWIKGGKTELVVQKLTELGAAEIIVFQARREVARGDETKTDRLVRVAIESCKQCERVSVPTIQTAASLKAALKLSAGESTKQFILHEREGAKRISAIYTNPQEWPPAVTFASGPEGGWHPDELAELNGSVEFVTMGQRILRAETAPLVAAAAVLALTGDI